ncbi:hypothetical protein SmJEL517_g00667 [Synchytrium microbalum]|uniref:Uncharacterized protein n=1 Tax=Synchytrium microbalum TaxID=1806994 RepID=A0A507CI19_9FUNG|nr:uncharacterized protein SmJEL517_g00667 [Synchytrium microbalum]TPX37724.1 hypothetical protein SmJEL517_g00667 [Synchytrium microbalum]
MAKSILGVLSALSLMMIPTLALELQPLWTNYVANFEAAAADRGSDGSMPETADSWFLPYRWDEHREMLRSMWIAPFVIFVLWWFLQMSMHALQWLSGRGVRRGEESRSLLAREEEATGVEPSEMVDRLAKASMALRTAFIMSLATAVVASLPLAFDCPMSKTPERSPVPIPPGARCGTCFDNGVTLSVVILQWVFLGLTVLWALLETITIDSASVAITRSILALASFPVIAAIFIIRRITRVIGFLLIVLFVAQIYRTSSRKTQHFDVPETLDQKLSRPDQPPPKYITCIFGPWTGMANNVISIQTSMAFAIHYNRTLIVPPLDNWEVTPSYWFGKVDGEKDSTNLDRQRIRLSWGSDAFSDPYRRFSKYFEFVSRSIEVIEMSDVDPTRAASVELAPLWHDGKMWCWQNPAPDTDFLETMEARYPVSLWSNESVACIGVPFEIRLHTARPKIRLSQWATQHAVSLLALNGLTGSKYLGIHLRRGNWDEYTSWGRFALSTFAQGTLKDDPIERRAPRDEYVVKAGQVLRKRLAEEYSIPDFPVVVTTNEKSNDSIRTFQDAGWIVLQTRLPDIPPFAQIALDLAVLAGGTGFVGQYGSTFTMLALEFRNCDIEHPKYPCGTFFGDADLLEEVMSAPVSSTPAVIAAAAPARDAKSFDWQKSLNRALGGGMAGASAMVVQVLTLMPMRTIMNYQYRHGGTMVESAAVLWKDGVAHGGTAFSGMRRYYRGLAPALIQGPLSRFGDTAANQGALALLDSSSLTADLPIAVKTLGASFFAASFRIFLTPVDTVKTILQTNGAQGMPVLRARLAKHGLPTLWYGAVATAAATFVGHYPWYAVYNYLQVTWPKYNDMMPKLARNAAIGFTASVVSDTISNSLRVIKTYRQTHHEKVSYARAVREVVAKDGVTGLFGRGLKTRILTNGLQGLMFSVLWKLFEDELFGGKSRK